MMALYVLGVFVSMLVIWRACDGFESASGYLGRNMSEGVRGATINAIGSSIPELLTACIALLWYTNEAGFAFGIGTTAGSAVFNSAIIPALVIMTVRFMKLAKDGITVSKRVVARDGLFLIMVELVLIVLLATGQMGPKEGTFLLLLYVLYACILYLSNLNSTEEPEEHEDDIEEKCNSTSCPGVVNRLIALLTLDLRTALLGHKKLGFFNSWLLLGAAVSVVGGACWLLVECCYKIGDGMGIGTYFVAVILAAAATSVPDTILSIKDAKEGNYNDAISNALGSNIFDVCVCLGLPVVLYSWRFDKVINLDSANDASVAELRALLLIITVLIFVLFMVGKKMNLFKAVLMLGSYGGFVAFIVGRAYDHPVANQVGAHLQTMLTFLK